MKLRNIAKQISKDGMEETEKEVIRVEEADKEPSKRLEDFYKKPTNAVYTPETDEEKSVVYINLGKAIIALGILSGLQFLGVKTLQGFRSSDDNECNFGRLESSMPFYITVQSLLMLFFVVRLIRIFLCLAGFRTVDVDNESIWSDRSHSFIDSTIFALLFVLRLVWCIIFYNAYSLEVPECLDVNDEAFDEAYTFLRVLFVIEIFPLAIAALLCCGLIFVSPMVFIMYASSKQ